MPLEEIRAAPVNGADEFPVGMRVLAVDDDPTCLMVLGGLLRKCQYQVTTTTHAKTALEMLREDRKRFDLIISDVYMPDMDGFRLLELIGLEMDLPVIMLSGNSEPKLVMKGINHGAVDYLVKPVRIEELRNIWQHVIRRKKSDSKNQIKNTSIVVHHRGNQESKIQDEPTGSDQRGKQSRKRKEEEEVEDEEESEENGTDSEDPSSHKKPRVVWSADLHQKFVDAVKQLGMKNAVPKRILETMNVEGISRENVASHLQKYRSYLKRVSSEVNHQLQANMMAAYRQEGSYLPMNALNGLGDFPLQSIPPNILSPSLSSYQTNPVLARLNSPSGVSLQSLSSSSPPVPLQVQTNHGGNPLDCSLSNASGHPLLQTQSRGVFANRPFLEVPSSNPQTFTAGFNGGSGGYGGNWQNTLPQSNLLPHTTPLCEPFGHNNQSNPLHFPSSKAMPVPDHFYNPNQSLSASNSMVPSCLGMGQFSQSLDQNDGSWGRITDSSLVSHSNINDLPLQELGEMDKLASYSLMKSSKDYQSEQMKSQGGFLYNGCDFSLDEIWNATSKPVQETMPMNPVFGFGAHSFS